MKTQQRIPIPKFLAIVGQSGSGKECTTTILTEQYRSIGIEPMFLNMGNLVREYSEVETPFGRKTKEIYKKGEIHPTIVGSSLYFMKLFQDYQDEQYIIIDGLPRQTDQFILMRGLVDAGYLESLLVLEVLASETTCKERLITRTEIDKRADLSIDGQPGIPDFKKLETKMSWWRERRDEIIQEVQRANCYASVKNEGTLEELKMEIQELFLFE